MRIVLLGAPGSGKGTQGKLLASKHKIPQISTGDLLRSAVSAGTDLGRQAKAAMDVGQLVSDNIVLGIIAERISEGDAKKGFILDGFPRNIPQAEALDRMLEEMKTPLQAALLIDVDTEVLIERLTGRRTCESCGQTYNVYTSPSRLDDRCDKCGGNLRHRADDNDETISNRLRVYEQQTSPLIAYYRTQDKLKTVKGEGGIKDIFAEMEKFVRKLPDQSSAAAAPAEGESPSLEDLHKKVMEAASRAKKPAKAEPAVKKAEPSSTAKPAAVRPAAVETKAVAKKVSDKVAVAEPAAQKKPAMKKAVAKKAGKKALTKKAPAKKAVQKKPAVKKAAAKKAPAKKKPTAKKGAAKKRVMKKPAPKKSVTKKAAAKKRPVAKRRSASAGGGKKAGKKKVAARRR